MNIITDTALSLSLDKVLEKMGLGAEKKMSFLLPKINLDQLKIILSHFSIKNNWSLIEEKNQDGITIFIFQVGQYGLNIKGLQRVTLLIAQENQGVKVAAVSKSGMGQLLDHGANQKNLIDLESYLKQNSQPDQLNRLLTNPAVFLPKKSTINPWYYLVVVAVFLLISSIYWYYNYRNSIRNLDEHVKQDINEAEKKLEYLELLPSTFPRQEEIQPTNPPATGISPTEVLLKPPIITYSPDVFNEVTKNEFQHKIIQPYLDYQQEVQNRRPFSIMVKKIQDVDYPYSIVAFYEPAGEESWLIKQIDYWFPDCMNGCQFSEAFRKKHPETVKAYLKANPS